MIARQLAFLADCAARLTEEDRAHRSALSPVRRLPLEVLGEIFKLVVPSFLNASDREMMGNMGRVCQRWRDALLNASSLWRGIILGPCLCPAQDTVGAVRRHEEDYKKLVTWFGRSGGCRKGLIYSSVDLHCRCDDGSLCKAVHPIVSRLINEGPKLVHLTLQLSGPSCFRNLLAALRAEPGGSPPDPLASLGSFSLEFVDDSPLMWDDGPDPTSSVFNLLPPVPALGIFLPLRESAFDDELASLECPIHIPPTILAPLVSLAIRWDWEGRGLLDVLEQCIALDSFTLDLARSEPFDGDVPPAPLELRVLTSFKLVKGGVRILDFLRTPALTSLDLELSVDRAATVDMSDRLDGFLRASEILGKLRFLRICELVGGPGIISFILPPLASLRHLVLDSSTACGYYFGQASTGHVIAPMRRYFPELRQVELLNLRRSRHVLTHEMQYFRRRGSAGMCMITVSYADEPKVSEAELQSRLRSTRDSGSRLSIRVVESVDYDEERALTL
ncbi:hypothetical protein DFP72DRAFT_918355 [Ephemerocybe angulata]|uniref:F-box domain-containing protein n=1 Tax=Ephemerocybe angulata TaxID=980116 RepID=A0A8H6M135_9AGAR|nr:hypothetical protein DFP72DRAFT_918355 [Tulosesus angulatus]